MGKPQKINTKKTLVKSELSDSGSDSTTPEFDDEPIEPLSGKPFCDFVFSKEKHLSRMVISFYRLAI